MTLGDLLSKTSNIDETTIMVSLYDANELLLITFNLAGYDNLDDWLVNEMIDKIIIINTKEIKIILKDSNNIPSEQP